MKIKEFFENRKCVELLLTLSDDVEEHYAQKDIGKTQVFAYIYKIATIITYIAAVISVWIASVAILFPQGIGGIFGGICVSVLMSFVCLFVIPVLLFYYPWLIIAVLEFFVSMTPKKHQKKFTVASFFLGGIIGIVIILFVCGLLS